MLKQFLFTGFFMLACNSLKAQDYRFYWQTITRIDMDIENNQSSMALMRFDSIYHQYSFMFAKHCIKALQLCCKINDTLRAEKFLAKCFKQGVPLWILHSNGLTQKCFHYKNCTTTLKNYDSFYNIYEAGINKKLAVKMDSLFAIDQYYTDRVNNGFWLFRYTVYGLQWLKNNKRQFAFIKSLTDSMGFPGEQLAGLPAYYLDSSIAAKNLLFYGPDVEDYRAYIMLIHYYSRPKKDINTLLFQNVITGFISAYHYGALNDFLARWGKQKYGKYEYYNVWHQDPDSTHLDSINYRRSMLGLNSFEQQEAYILKNRQKRKEGNIGLEIIKE